MSKRQTWIVLLMVALWSLAGCGGDGLLQGEEVGGDALSGQETDAQNNTNHPAEDTSASNPNNTTNPDATGDTTDPDSSPDATGDTRDAAGDTGPPWIDSETIGTPCLLREECDSGEFCIGASPEQGTEGYCTILDCVSHSDCEFPGEDTFCCSDFGEYRGCWMEDPGSICGDTSGQAGDSCADGGQSDCEGTHTACLELYDPEDPLCFERCDPFASSESCPENSACVAFSSNFAACIPHEETLAYDPCADDPYACDAGLFCIGAGQGDLYAYCAQLCEWDGECASDEWCQRALNAPTGVCSPAGVTASGDSCTEDRFDCAEGLFCLESNSRQASCSAPCADDSACDPGQWCFVYDTQNLVPKIY